MIKKRKSIYKDALHELVKPILTDTPTDRAKRKKKVTQLRRAARQEEVWAKSANTEGRSERKRALRLLRGDPFRTELLSDSRIAFSFGKIRIQRRDKLYKLADNLSRSLERGKR